MSATPNATVPIEEEYRYKHLIPVFDKETRYPPLTPFDHEDPALRALKHDNPRSFLDSAQVVELTPDFGSEVKGLDLSVLSSDEKDQLALEVEKRGILVFRGQQNFIDAHPDKYLEWGRHFGRLHIHPTSGHPKGYPEFHLVYRDGESTYNFEKDEYITSTLWHSDVSYELQPPGITTFFLLSSPTTGGDTSFANQRILLQKLSPSFVSYLRTLTAVHSGVDQANFSRSGKRGGIVRREPVEHVHPVIRKHPVTGEEALYVNRQFTRRIVGLKKEESDLILNFLYSHIDRSQDAQVRLKWEPYTIAIWDNRSTAHTAILDFKDRKERRHGARITAQAERPLPAVEGLDLSGP
ncbi:hypothetical protein DL96DRAFT_1713644 [Flagelloscypha sp. PMI_526]|nr:hypothetical protein DL96DRAFT_1713644 [Flagelloscypha sp. PMI_526]